MKVVKAYKKKPIKNLLCWEGSELGLQSLLRVNLYNFFVLWRFQSVFSSIFFQKKEILIVEELQVAVFVPTCETNQPIPFFFSLCTLLEPWVFKGSG